MRQPLATGQRVRARQLGISIGRFKPGAKNAITDVKGVKVGHSTIIEGSGKLKPGYGPVRTGVTAILPNAGAVFHERIIGGGFVLNGAGEIAGMTQVQEWGLIETPILLTNTLAVGAVSDATVKHLVAQNPGIGNVHDVIIPIVGECDDSWLNDIVGRHVRPEHVVHAIESASDGAVREGNVGGGTGMITCDFSGGIGTSSRKLAQDDGGYTLGMLVLSNFGVMDNLRMDGIPVGRMLKPHFVDWDIRQANYGSIIAVLATDAPLLPHQIGRICKRVALGIGRTGSHAAHGSGEIIIGFSTANTVPRETKKGETKVRFLLDTELNPLYEAAIDATEEAILNAICMASDIDGVDGHRIPGLPLDMVRRLVAAEHKLRADMSELFAKERPLPGRDPELPLRD